MKSVFRGWLALGLSSLVGCTDLALAETKLPDPYQARFEKMSGRDLVLQLSGDATRSRAFYELTRRAVAEMPDLYVLFGHDEGYEVFARTFPAPTVILCPQAGGALPIHLVAYNSLGRFRIHFGRDEMIDVPRPLELFPPLAEYVQPPIDPRLREVLAFTSEGKLVDVVMSSNTSPDKLIDLTGDGVLENVFIERCMLGESDRRHASLLKITTVEEKPRVLLSLLLNWEADAWTYRVRDTNGDGLPDLELGPRTAAGIQPKVVFRWDPAAQAFRGPAPKSDDHFRVLQNRDDPGPELKEFAADGLRFPDEPDAVSEEDLVARKAAAEDEKHAWKEFPQRLPADFWSLEPKAAALAFAEANRTSDHRANYRTALEDRDGATPPASGSLALKEGQQGCFGASGSEWFLHFDPAGSHLLSAHSRGRQSLLAGNDLDLRWEEIPYADAHRIAAVVWWLDRLRTYPAAKSTIGFSTTSHRRWLDVRDADGVMLLQRAEISSFSLWDGPFTRKLELEAVAWLVSKTLPRREDPAAVPEDDDRRGRGEGEVQTVARRVLEAWTPNETHVSHTLTAAAVKLLSPASAGIADRLRVIASQIPRTNFPPGRSSEEIEKDLQNVADEISDASSPRDEDPDGSAQTKKLTKLRARQQSLQSEDERMRIRSGMKGEAALRSTIEAALGGESAAGTLKE